MGYIKTVSSITSTEAQLMPHTCIMSSVDKKFWFWSFLDSRIANKGLWTHTYLFSLKFLLLQHIKNTDHSLQNCSLMIHLNK